MPRGRAPKLTEEQKIKLREEFLAGSTTRDLYKKYGCCDKVILGALREEIPEGDILRRRKEHAGSWLRKLTNEQEDTLCASYREGTQIKALSSTYGIHVETVKYVLRKHLPLKERMLLKHEHVLHTHKGKVLSESTRRKISDGHKALGLVGEKSPCWKGGRVLTPAGKYAPGQSYVMLYQGSASSGSGTEYELEHRLVMEKHLGRKLRKDEFVHHRNGQKMDNRLENLEVVKNNSHRGRVKCPKCGFAYSVH